MVKSRAHIAAPIHEDIYEHAARVIIDLRQDPMAIRGNGELVRLIMRLVNSSFDFYFLSPLQSVKAGGMTVKVAQMGLSSTEKGMHMVMKKVIASLDATQLLSLADFIETIIFQGEGR
ncbi:MAG: hypothetical protein IPM37_08345 [Hahellaceae bacterium]|jgi:hypothetical protein|nr:hypothetical protein [Hahellaceae bacterium]